MNTKSMIKKIKLNDESFRLIKEEVAKQELRSTGEIALAITPESNDYSFWELIASTYLSSVTFIIMLFNASKITRFCQSLSWDNQDWYVPAFFGIIMILVLLVGFWISNIPAIDRFIIPKQVQHKFVTDRAFQHFAQSGVYETKEHTGILIFVSYLEHQVRIIADSGISSKVPQDLWNLIADDLASNLKENNVTEGFIQAVQKCGDLLAENFPPHEENPNELPDGLVILGGSNE